MGKPEKAPPADLVPQRATPNSPTARTTKNPDTTRQTGRSERTPKTIEHSTSGTTAKLSKDLLNTSSRTQLVSKSSTRPSTGKRCRCATTSKKAE